MNEDRVYCPSPAPREREGEGIAGETLTRLAALGTLSRNALWDSHIFLAWRVSS
jgi:hypothetical protein